LLGKSCDVGRNINLPFNNQSLLIRELEIHIPWPIAWLERDVPANSAQQA
jgi:hypothetical protein